MTPEQEEQVRRALASAPLAGAMPSEVAARLDATLADLVAGRSAEATTTRAETTEASQDDPLSEVAPVVALAERRRRRWPRVLVAAAAVTVVAYGVGVTLDGLQVSGGSADSTAARDETFAGAGNGADSADGGSEAAPEDAPTGLLTDRNGAAVQSGKLLVPGTVRLHRASLRDDVRRLVGGTLEARTPVPTKGQVGALDALAACEPPETARGDRLAAARLDGRAATLVLRKAEGGTRVAEVYSCGDGSRLLAVTRVPSAE